MRIALCFSGQPRFIQRTHISIRDFLIDMMPIDTFWHTWKTGHDFSMPSDFVLKYLNTKDMIFEDQKLFDTPYKNVYSMFYSIRQVDLLRRRYEEKHSFSYDFVIRSRTDLRFFGVPEIHQGPVLFPEGRGLDDSSYKQEKMLEDQFAIGSSTDMVKYADTYDYLSALIMKAGKIHPETLLYYSIIEQNKMSVKHTRRKFELIQS